MNRVVLFRQLSKQMCQLMEKERLTDAEYGNLAMAVQGLDNDLKAEQHLRAIERCVQMKNISEACYRTIILVYKDWKNRVAYLHDAAYHDIIEEIWRIKQGEGNNDTLNSFVLVKRYSDYPAFYRALDTMNILVGR